MPASSAMMRRLATQKPSSTRSSTSSCSATLEKEVGVLGAARGGRTCVAKEAARNPRHSVVSRVAPEVVAEERHRECDTATLWPVEQALALQSCDQRLDPVVGQVQQLQEGLD